VLIVDLSLEITGVKTPYMLPNLTFTSVWFRKREANKQHRYNLLEWYTRTFERGRGSGSCAY